MVQKSKKQIYSTFRDGLWQMMTGTHHVVSKARRRELQQYGLTANDSVVLFAVLRMNGLANPAALSRDLFWEPHTVSEQLKSMEARGLISKAKDAKRRNVVRVEATEKGLNAYRQAARRRSTREIVSVLNKEEQVQLWTLLAKLREEAMRNLGMEVTDAFPPADPAKYSRRGSR